jgi:hypothetical protein
MRTPRIRFGVGGLMVGIALFALAFWWFFGRREHFRRLAAYHQAQVIDHTTSGIGPERSGGLTTTWFRTTPQGEWHRMMMRKYWRSASKPWLPVEPDPPLPLPGQVLVIDPYDPDAEPYFDEPDWLPIPRSGGEERGATR